MHSRCTYPLPKYAAGYMSSLLSNLVTLRSPVFRFSVAQDPCIPVETADQITHKDRTVNDIRSHVSGLNSIRRIYRITTIANPGNGERAVSLLADEFQSCRRRKKRGPCYLKVEYEKQLWSDEGSLMVHLVVTALVSSPSLARATDTRQKKGGTASRNSSRYKSG
jgi:hypothetical protein